MQIFFNWNTCGPKCGKSGERNLRSADPKTPFLVTCPAFHLFSLATVSVSLCQSVISVNFCIPYKTFNAATTILAYQDRWTSSSLGHAASFRGLGNTTASYLPFPSGFIHILLQSYARRDVSFANGRTLAVLVRVEASSNSSAPKTTLEGWMTSWWGTWKAPALRLVGTCKVAMKITFLWKQGRERGRKEGRKEGHSQAFPITATATATATFPSSPSKTNFPFLDKLRAVPCLSIVSPKGYL